MNYCEFQSYICDRVKERLGEDYKISIYSVLKNNSLELEALMIQSKTENICPTIYLEKYYGDYCNGNAIDEIVDAILALYNSAIEQTPSIDMNNFAFEDVKSQIYFRLINNKKNKQLLQNVPHKRHLDLAITFHCLVESNPEGIKSFMITNHLIQLWNTDVNELYQLAEENTPRLFPLKINTMEEVLESLLYGPKNYENLENVEDQMVGTSSVRKTLEGTSTNTDMTLLVATNQMGTNGAAVIFYPDFLAKTAKKYQKNLILLPSSIHEFLILPEDEDCCEDYLTNMVLEVNRTEVATEDILSDHIYYYDWMEDKLRC